MIFDIVPTHGYHMLMDGFPGIIVSDDDFGINSAGTDGDGDHHCRILRFSIPTACRSSCARARPCSMPTPSISSSRSCCEGNNGGYANDWLLADNNTGEVARFEIGLKLHRVWRTKDGYFVGANFPSDPELIKEETDFDPNNMSSSPNARHKRWEEFMPREQGTDRCCAWARSSWPTTGTPTKARKTATSADFAAMAIIRRPPSRPGANRPTAPWARLPRRLPTAPWRRNMTLAGARRTSLRRGFYRRHLPQRTSRVRLAEADSAGYEGQSLDRVQGRR